MFGGLKTRNQQKFFRFKSDHFYRYPRYFKRFFKFVNKILYVYFYTKDKRLFNNIKIGHKS